MRKALLLLTGMCMLVIAKAQLLTWSPQFPNDNSTIVTTMDANFGNQGLLNHSGAVYMHLGVITNLSTSNTDWRYVTTTWGSTTAPTATPAGTNKWTYTITNPRAYFNVPAGETIRRVALLFRDAAGNKVQKNTDGTDMFIPIFATGTNGIQITNPFLRPTFDITNEPVTASIGSNLPATAIASTTAGTLKMYLNGTQFSGPVTGNNTISGNATITAPGNQRLVAELNMGATSVYDTVDFYVTPVVTVAPLPTGVKEGINYDANCTAATLVLYAPGKSNVMVIGDFAGSNWLPQTQYQMNRTPDGNYYWLTINGLTSGTEYAYQYLVDGNIYIADPYSEKILDPYNDQYIPASTYPSLKPYPTNPNVSAAQNGIVSVLQTCAPAYNWQVTNFTKPDKRNLMTYEMLIRDFGGAAPNNFQLLIDTLSYFKRLGINALELMPVSEFSGNQSWGYNPTFFYAIDKAYGPKNKLKELIDSCHANGIAVIMDVVYNHEDAYTTPHGKLYWNAATGKPAANNPWLNQDAPHPYSVFNDFNHTSTATQYFVIRNLRFWLDEFKVDGFRFDLAKGFTQTVSNTSTVENYDASRVANLKRYYDSIIPAHPGTYMILEFLGTQRQEEQEYANMGFMLWGNNNATYNQATMGYVSNSDFSKIVYNSSQSAFTTPAAFGYMESHDEERLMYKNLQFGNVSGSYNVKDLATALVRQAAAASLFFTVPGPKMFWQFGERGYDESLVFGGSNVANKPPHWEYMADANRLKLWNAYKQLIKLRLDNPAVFNNTTFSYDFFDGNGLVKRFQIADPAANGKKVTVIANFDVIPQTRNITFQTTGQWSNYLSDGMTTGAAGINGPTGSTFSISTTTQAITLQPGEYHVYLYEQPCTTPAPGVTTPAAYCQNAPATQLTAAGTGLLWYNTGSGGVGSATAPTPNTTTAGTVTYYVSQTLNGCEGPRAAIVVNVTATPAAPTVTTPVNYCQNATATALTATGSNLLWYTVPTNGTGATLAPTPITNTTGSATYYVSQSTVGGCEGPRAAIVVNVNAVPAAPSVTAAIAYCQNATATPLTATGTNLLWYTVPVNGTGNTTAPTPVTTSGNTTNYYVSQTVNGCESPRAQVTVTVTTTPAAPSVVSPIAYCQNSTATALTATGTGLLWYPASTGGGGNATAPIPSTSTIGSTNYYVSQTINGCEGPRALITVNITASTPAPAVTSPVQYCQNATATALTAIGTNLLWYPGASGGSGSTTAPIPVTTAAGSITYYVSQTSSCGEGPRAAIVVNVTATPTAPVAATPITYCQNATATALTATGTNLLWYTLPSGGSSSTTAPIPVTTTAGNNNYYVSQSVNGCEGPRATIAIVINATPAAPTVTTPVTYCQNATATALTATGSNLLWYASPTGGSGTATAPIPATATAGNTNYYVSQSVNGCEGPRATIMVTVTPSTTAPTVTSPVTYCQNATATALTATGTNLLWYTVPVNGTGNATAPVPVTTAAGTTTYYVSQTPASGGCGEGPRAAIVVNINATPAAPTVTTPIAYCQNATATALTATGSNLLWYTVPTNGTSSATAPVPSTTAGGSTTYYVSQSVSGCEGPRASIVVNVTATPAAPTVTTPVTYCQNATATVLTATGTNLLWYTVPSGGTGVATAPTPITTAGGTTNYYVSQSTVGGCESPRALIAVIVNALPAAPTVTSPVTYCQNVTAPALTATGTNLIWHTAPTGGTGTATAPIPVTTAAGSTTYYVSQSASGGCGEGPRVPIVVNVTATPAAANGLSVSAISNTSATLSWTAIAGVFYTIEYRMGSTGAWTTAGAGISTGSVNLTGLTSGATYEWRVSANCAAANAGNYTNGTPFVTATRNNTITNLKDGFGIKITPNPATTQAIIDYIVPGSGITTLMLYSKTGNRIALLYQGVRQPGQYLFNFTNQLTRMAAGIYYVHLQQNGKGITLYFVKENN